MFETTENVKVSQFVYNGYERLFLLGPLVSIVIAEANKEGWEWVASTRDTIQELPTVGCPEAHKQKYASGNVLAELRREVTPDTKSPRAFVPSGFLM
jgi:hypothetical protein